MREQRGVGYNAYLPHPTEHRGASSAGHSAGIHPDDAPHHTDDYMLRQVNGMLPDAWIAPARRGTSVMRAGPRSIIRVTTHEGALPIQRASKIQPYTQPAPESTPVIQRRQAPKHCLFYIGIGLCVMLLGGIWVNMLVRWVQVTWDDRHYGRPRTYQTDADVGHGGVSHFTVENLGGHIFIMEIIPADPKKIHLYVGPAVTGGDASLAVATISFKESNQSGLPDMVITVNGGATYVFVNTKDGFKPLNDQGG
jgi:hypothetical protein